MTTDGDPHSDDTKWDGPRIVLGRVADVIRQHLAKVPPEHVTRQILEAEVDNWDQLPELTRKTLGELSPAEQDAVTKVIQNLAADHFYIEGGPGGLRGY